MGESNPFGLRRSLALLIRQLRHPGRGPPSKAGIGFIHKKRMDATAAKRFAPMLHEAKSKAPCCWPHDLS